MDSRKDMTKRLIADGFKALMLRYPFEKISIMMITNEAGIRRPSFYNHFQDKYDLLAWIVETDVIAPAGEPLRRGDGVVARDHGQVCRVEVDAHALAAEAVEERAQGHGLFRAGLDGEAAADLVAVFAHGAAGLLHDGVARVGGVRGDDADVGRDDRAAQVQRQVHDAQGALDLLGVVLGAGEGVAAHVPAQGGDLQAQVADVGLQVPARLGVQRLGRHLAGDGVDLHAVCAKVRGLFEALAQAEAEAVRDDADLHSKDTSLPALSESYRPCIMRAVIRLLST